MLRADGWLSERVMLAARWSLSPRSVTESSVHVGLRALPYLSVDAVHVGGSLEELMTDPDVMPQASLLVEVTSEVCQKEAVASIANFTDAESRYASGFLQRFGHDTQLGGGIAMGCPYLVVFRSQANKRCWNRGKSSSLVTPVKPPHRAEKSTFHRYSRALESLKSTLVRKLCCAAEQQQRKSRDVELKRPRREVDW